MFNLLGLPIAINGEARRGFVVFRKMIISSIVAISILLSSAAMPVFAAPNPDEYNAVTVTKILERTDVFQLKAKGSILMDGNSGSVLLESNSHERLPIASVTKVMSMLLIMEAIDAGKIRFEDTVPITPYVMSFGGSQLWLDVRESNKYTVAEILKAIAVHSANDATVAMAEMIAGSEKAFVDMMNQRAKELGLNDTNYLDCTGLTDIDHYSSAYDIAIASRELITKHPKIFDFTTIRHDKFGEGKRAKPTDLDNTNKLIGRYDGINGLKTGFTNKAGFNLSATAKRNNVQLIAVVLGEPDSNTRFAEIQRLLDYGFTNFESAQVNKKGEEASIIEVKKGLQTSVKAVYPENISFLIKKGDKNKIVRDLRVEASLTAPIEAGQKVGHIVYMIDGKEVGKADLVAEMKVERASFVKLFTRMMKHWFGIGRI